MFGIPVGLLIRIGIALAIAAACWYAFHLFTSHYEAIGAARVQLAWDQDKARRIEQVTAQTLAWDAQRQKTEVAINERDKARQEAATAIRKQSAALPQVVRDQSVPAAFVGVLRSGRDQANAAGAAAEPDKAATASTAGADSSLGLIADWIAEVTDILAECRDRVAGWSSFYAGLRAAQPKEQPQ